MRRGFLYDTSLCVNCKACSAACILENGLNPGTRTVLTWNRQALTGLQVINISLACNHCQNPACLTGCPAGAYSLDISGAVIHDREKCIGCRYCTWLCPYDAPKPDPEKGYIVKCHFCTERLREGIDPACVTACPTDAIKIINEDTFTEPDIKWFPAMGLEPSVRVEGRFREKKPVVYPEDREMVFPGSDKKTNKILNEWSLAAFSLLVAVSSVIILSSFLRGASEQKFLVPLLLLIAMAVSFLHLGVRRKAWRAPLHFISSPLSREILAVTLLMTVTLFSSLVPGLVPPEVTPIIALLTLISVDLVYFTGDRSMRIRLHSGQVFFSALLATSFFSGHLNAFIVFTLLAAGSVVLRYNKMPADQLMRTLFYYRALSLPVTLMLLYAGNEPGYIGAMILMIAGIITDRLLFYAEFNPVNIKEKKEEIFYEEYEKERS